MSYIDTHDRKPIRPLQSHSTIDIIAVPFIYLIGD